jgi:hypothetical protein
MLDAFTKAFDAFSAGANLWTCCMQIAVEINARESQALAKNQATKSKRLHATTRRENGGRSNNRIRARPVRRVVLA